MHAIEEVDKRICPDAVIVEEVYDLYYGIIDEFFIC